jgi:hypothetical protein
MDDIITNQEIKKTLHSLLTSVKWEKEKNHKVGSITLPIVVRKGQKIAGKLIEDILQADLPRNERIQHKLQIFALVETQFGLVKHRWGVLTVR